MRMSNFMTSFLAIILMLIFLQHLLVVSLSPLQQKTALFQFQQSFSICTPNHCLYYSNMYFCRSPSYSKLNWSMSSDYCTWEGVTCDHKTRDVIGLDLGCSQMQGAFLPNNTLFQLSHLQFLNLSMNDFSLSTEFPQEFGFFAKGLTRLDLSSTGLSGTVPSGISRLYKLVALDLSYNSAVLLENQMFKSLLQNLTQLRVLNLYRVNINSVLPLNLSTSLRVLNLGNTGLYGVLPQEVFHLPNLELLDLTRNENLIVILPKVKWGSSASLQHLSLREIDFHGGGLPDSIGFLDSLATLDLYFCNLSGPIPKSLGNLIQLTYLDLSSNNLNGPIFTYLANLTSHSSELTHLNLYDNAFTGQFYEFDPSNSQLQVFDCSNNSLYGPIPQSFSQLVNLTWLDFSSNNFSGILDIEMFSRLESLAHLDLSYNSLSVRNKGVTSLPLKLEELGLSSCNMKEFPRFSGDAKISLRHVDLSNNDIEGEIPHWIGSVYEYLNISHNTLTGGLEQLHWNKINYLDLQSNKLNGSLPTLICNSRSLQLLNLSNNTLSGVLPICQTGLSGLTVFDLRNNNFQGNIPTTLSNFRYLETINLNGNKLEGRIPSSFAEFDYLQVLDLGNNQIKDAFPQCLEALPNLQVLVLKSNKFHGIISKSSEVEHPFPSLRIIDLSYNDFSGPLPTKYFRNFKEMMNGEVNKIERSYMERDYYSDSTNLVIKGKEILLNKILTVYTTIDVSKNNFEGKIPVDIGYLVSLRFLNLSHNHLTGQIPPSIGKLIVLESLDLSTNQLEGEIPQQLTGLYSLALLNLSCNQLRGHIPEGSQFDTFANDSYVGNLGLCGNPLSKKCGHNNVMQEEDEDEDNGYFFSGFTWEAVVIGYGCGVVPAFIIGYLMLLARKPKWFAGIIARELGLKIRRMEIKWKY